MGKSYRTYLPDQDLLLPPSLREWLPENHLVYFVSDVVDNLNLSALDAVYGDEQRGQPPYDPRMMTKVLVYGYCVGVFSSRRIERRLAEDVGFRVLAAGNAPNFRTIADFRKLHLATLAGLFEEVLKLALEAGALKLGRVALDGTKVQANAINLEILRKFGLDWVIRRDIVSDENLDVENTHGGRPPLRRRQRAAAGARRAERLGGRDLGDDGEIVPGIFRLRRRLHLHEIAVVEDAPVLADRPLSVKTSWIGASRIAFVTASASSVPALATASR